ncbi:MAG: hypothetical protein ACI9R3_004525 [Verrucomicrobiales bacterium]|jgi:hypothetical protein
MAIFYSALDREDAIGEACLFLIVLTFSLPGDDVFWSAHPLRAA